MDFQNACTSAFFKVLRPKPDVGTVKFVYNDTAYSGNKVVTTTLQRCDYLVTTQSQPCCRYKQTWLY